ncbi:hypothetical protein [Neptunomonas sp.]|uniref:hypothetical protein n=1 Tax=Neptunomonas sp. TaxID=1971898 RepID=UPI0025DCA905|nr:hypothetical protein [Neptunomonas sp.]
MVFQRSRTAVYRYLGKRLEMALGLGLILVVTVIENILSSTIAVTIFVAVLLVRLPSVKKGFEEFSYTLLTIDKDTLTVTTKQGDTQYQLDDFKIMLYKKRAKAITVFVLMSENDGVKFEYYQQMNELFDTLSESVMLRKEIPWWQRL